MWKKWTLINPVINIYGPLLESRSWGENWIGATCALQKVQALLTIFAHLIYFAPK